MQQDDRIFAVVGGCVIAAVALTQAVWKKVPSLWLVGGGLVAGIARMLLT